MLESRESWRWGVWRKQERSGKVPGRFAPTVRPLNTWILFRLDFGPFVVNWGVNGTFESDFLWDILCNCVFYQYLIQLSEYISTWILVVKSTLLISLDVGKSRILTMRGLTKTRTKWEGTGSFRPRKWVDSPHLIAKFVKFLWTIQYSNKFICILWLCIVCSAWLQITF
jgi:hypothetical protein